MSSAAKLRRFGKGTAAVAVAATVMTAFGPVAMAWPDVAALQAAAGGASIGMVDTDQTTAVNEGATLLQAGAADQALGDMRLVIPNTFANGDVIDIYFFDREATGDANTPATDGSLNIDAGHQFTLTKAPTVNVDAKPYAATTQVTPITAALANNTERPAGVLPYTPPPAPASQVTPVAPKLVAELEKGTNSFGGTPNVLRLRVDGSSSKGDGSAKWIVTLSGAQVTLGANVSPGEIRAVPFARTATNTPGQYTDSPMFGDPAGGDTNDIDTDPVLAGYQYNIGVYTVPSYVSPVKVTQAEPTMILGDNTPQTVGAITITETQPYSLVGSASPGTAYTVWVTGASVMNTATDQVKVEIVDPATGESVTTTGVPGVAGPVPGAPAGVTGVPITFNLVQTDVPGAAAKLSSIKLSNIKLQATSNGPISYRLTGGSIDDAALGFLTTAGGAADPDGAGTVLAPAGDFGGVVNQTDIAPPTDELVLRGSASAGTSAIGGNNRYETARKIAKEWSPLGDDAIIASGENYPDALSSGFLSQRLGAPIILTMQGSVPADTMESLRERGVRKVYLIGGEAAISKGVSDKLLATPAYMWSDSAKNLVPRGGNLEVVRLGGSSRYSTNALVNMYAAAQNTGVAVVGTTSPAYGSPNKTTAMIARGDNFADALTANVLTSGRNTGLFTAVGGTSLALNSTTGPTLTAADLASLGAGTYELNPVDPDGAGPLPAALTLQRNVGGTLTTVATEASAGSAIYNRVVGGTITLTEAAPGVLDAADGFVITSTTATDYVPQLENLNALPVIITPKGELGDQAKNELSTLHIEHALIIGGADVIPDAVMKSVDGMNITTRRLAGTDRYDTARVVNEYAWTPASPSTTNTTPGLGFDGGKTTVGTATFGQAEAFLANGTRFPDALVAGPWVSRRHDAMVLVLQGSIPDPTKKFLTDNAAVLDRAIGLGLGSAVSSAVITEANKIVSSK